jgi:hypothetical protein
LDDAGIISNGWILTLSTGVPVENDSDLQVTVNPVPASHRQQSADLLLDLDQLWPVGRDQRRHHRLPARVGQVI